jgi:serine/threonine protein kinase
MIPMKEISFNKFHEDQDSSADLPSSTQVRLKQFRQDLKTLVKIQKNNPRDFFNFGRKIGEGGFSKVFQVTHKETSKVSALKQIKIDKNERKNDVINEIGMMQISRHANIIECFSCYQFEK